MKQIVSMTNDNGEEYDIPTEYVESFRKTFPKASSTTSYRTKNGDEYAIPEAQDEAFRKTFPDATPLRRVSFADGSTRDFTMPELSKFLRSKEWREGEQYKADRDERNAKVAAKMGGDGEMHSPTWAAIKGGLKGAAQGFWQGGNAAANKIAKAIPEIGISLESALGNAINLGGNAPNAVGNWFLADAKSGKAWLDAHLPDSVKDWTGYEDWSTKTADKFAEVSAMGYKFAPAMATGGSTALVNTMFASDGLNAASQTFDNAINSGYTPAEANAAAAASFLVNYYGAKLVTKAGGVADSFKNPILHQLGAASGVGTTMGVQSAANRGIENVTGGRIDETTGFPDRKIRPLTEGMGEAFAEGATEGILFHAINAIPGAVVGGANMAAQRMRETREMKEYRKDSLLAVARGEDGGELLDTLLPAKGLDGAIRARKGGADVSRKMAQGADLPDNMSVAERNEVIDAIIKARGERAAQNAVKVDGFRADALDAAIKEVGGEGEVAQDIRARVLRKLKNARELDDPFRREELIGEAFEEWNKEHKQEKPNETGNVPDEKPAQPQPPVETRAEGAEAVRPVEGEPPRGEAPRPDVVKPAEKPTEPPQGSQEPPLPPKTGEDTPKPAEGVETPSRASDATGGDAVSSYISGMKPLERSRVTKVLNRRGVYEDGKTAAESISALVGTDSEVRAQHNGKGGVDYIIGDTFGNKTEADFARHVGVKVNEESILRAQEEASLFKTMKKAEQVTRSRGFTGGDFSVPTSDKALQEQIDKLNTIGKYQPEANTRLKALEAVKAGRIKRGTWEGDEGISKTETTTPPAKPVPDGKGKMVKPKAAESDYGVTMFEEPAVDGEGVSYVVKDGPSDAHRMMFKSKAEAEARLAKLRAERKAIKESPSATLADGTKVHLLKTDEGWVPYDEYYNDLTQGMFKAAKTKAEAIKVAEKGVKWAEGVAEENARFKGESAKPKPDGKGKMVKPKPTEPPKTTAPVVDETGKTAEVAPPDSVEAKISAMKRGSPEQLKAQKEYFETEIAKAEEAIKGKLDEPTKKKVGSKWVNEWKPKKDAGEVPPSVTIKIPGDGEFTVPNNPDGIARLKKVAAKFKPAPKKGVVETDSTPREPSLKPAEKPKIESAEKETALFVSDGKREPLRKSVSKPFSDGEYVYATDVRMMVRRPLRKGEKVNGENDAPIDATHKVVKEATANRENDTKIKASVSELYPKLIQAGVIADLRPDYLKKGAIQLWRGSDGKLQIRTRDDAGNEYFTDGLSKSSKPLAQIQGEYLQNFLKLVAKSGGGEIEISVKDAESPLLLKGGGWDAVLMPLRTDDSPKSSPASKAKKPASDIQPQKPLGEPTKGEKSATIGDTIAELDPSEKPTKNNPLGQIVVPAEGSIAQSIDADIAADEAFAAKTKGRSQGSPPAPAPGSAANPNLDSGYEPKSLGAGVKSPVARQQIVDKFKELFGDTVAIRGKNTTNIGKNYAGHYEPDAGIIRSKDTASLRTIPHELGHHIDALTKRMLIPRPAAAKQELIALGRKLYGNRRPNGGYQAEGFAELLKYYLQGNDAGLLREAPEAYRWLTRTFARRVPDTMAKIDAVRDMIDRFQNQSAEQAVRVIRAKDKSLGEKVVEEVAQLAKGLKPTQENWIDEGAFITKGMRASGIDRLFDWLASGKSGASAEMIDKVKNHPVFKWKLYNGKAGGKAFNSLNKGLFNLSGSRRYTYGDLGVPTAGHSASEMLPTFNDIFGKFSAKEMDEFQNYAIARVAKEAYLDRGLEFGLAAEEIAPVLRKHANNAKFRDALDRYTHYKHGVLHLLVDAGAMSQQQFEAIVAENPIYVKIARRRENAVDLFRDAMLKRKGKAVNKRTGSNRQIEDIFDAGLIDDERVIKAAFQADILRSLVDAGKRAEAAGGVEAGYSIGANWIHEVPNSQGEVKFAAEKLRKQVVDALRNAGATGANGETGGDLFDALFGQNATLSVFKEKASNGKSGLVSLYDESGKLHTYELPENNAEGWAKALMGFTDRTAPNVVEKWFQIATAATRSGATLLNPYFAARNLVRDSMHAAAVNDVGIFIPGVSSVEGLVHDWLNTNPKQIYDAMNLGMGTMLGEAKLASAHKANRYLMSRNWFEAQWRKGITKAVADVIGVTENASRIKAFKNAYDAMIKMGADHEAASIIAGCNALDITLDFQRGGGAARKINRAIPFFNAGIQGLEKFARAHGIVKPKEWSFQRSRTKIAARTIAQELATITLLAIASELYNRSDDDRRRKYGELPSYEKNNYISFGDMRIPVPYESGYVFASIPRAVFEELYDGREGAVAESVAMFRKTLPGLSLDDIAGLGPFLQVSANKDWRNITIVEEHIKKSRKVYDWYTPQTSEFSKRLSKALYQLCNKDNPPEWIAPAYLDTIFNGLTGNLYGRTVGAIGGAKEFDISRPHTYPLVGTFFRNPTTSRLANDFYRKRQSLTQGFGSRELTPEENGQRLAMDEVAKELAPLWEENRMLSSRRDLSTKERNDQIEANTFKALDAIRNFNDRDKASDRKSGIAAAAGALTASAEISKDVRSKNLAVLKGISYEEAAAALKAYGREKMQTPVRNSRGFKTGRMKTHPRWTNETIQKRLRILRRVMDEEKSSK